MRRTPFFSEFLVKSHCDLSKPHGKASSECGGPLFFSEFLVKSLCDLSKPHGKTNQFPFVNPDHEVGFLAFFENQIIVCSLCESRILTRIHSLFQKQNHYVFSLWIRDSESDSRLFRKWKFFFFFLQFQNTNHKDFWLGILKPRTP